MAISNNERVQTKVAVVGSGLAGLVTAYLLRQDPKKRFTVTLFEEVRFLPSPKSNYATNVLSCRVQS